MLIALGLACLLQASEPTPIESSITRVTVFPTQALVERGAPLPSASGRFVITGLPTALEPDSVRVRCLGAEVVGLETRERFRPAIPSERAEELRQHVRGIEGELEALADERAVLAQVGDHLQNLVAAKPTDDKRDEQATSGPNAWRANLLYLEKQLTANRRARLENAWKIEEVEQRLADAKLAVDGAAATNGAQVRDVIVAVEGGAGAARVELEYVVANAGWQPLYDLRTAADASSVELSYRAQVWQRSGEDWKDVELALSTAEPRRGAQGPDPRAIWLRLVEPLLAGLPPPTEFRALDESARDKADDDEKAPATPRPFASVESQGLSVRFRLASRETIESRNEPSTVLVGQTTLAVAPEYYATPSLDSNVWLRARAKNTSEWTLLAGRAAVYFGADFLGQTALEQVLPGAEFVLHIGPDPALSIERSQLEDMTSGPGLFGSKSAHKETFRVRLKNNGAAVTRADGSALVFVREALPRATDDRIKIELADSKPALAQEERWTRDRDERGVLTWPVSVPRGGEATLVFSTKISYPEGAHVVAR